VRLFAVFAVAGCLLAPLSSAGTRAGSWADPQIRIVTARGLMGGDPASFRPEAVLTAGTLAKLVTGITVTPAPAPADPATPVTMAGLDSALVRGLGLGDVARELQVAAQAAGLEPPSRFGTEVVARLLGLRTDHARDALERGPKDPATRAEAAFSAAEVLMWKGWEADAVRELATTFVPPATTGWQQTVLREAVSLVGYPYVYAGTEEHEQKPLGKKVPGGFDCSGLVWRVYKLAPYAEGTALADTIEGRSTMDMSAEVPKSSRIRFKDVQPGDVLFFGARGPRSKPAEIDHAGIALGGGWMIHSSGQGVTIVPLSKGYRARFAWARRPLAEAGLTARR
jgi:cell wall-associated NlpC family hydrolase